MIVERQCLDCFSWRGADVEYCPSCGSGGYWDDYIPENDDLEKKLYPMQEKLRSKLKSRWVNISGRWKRIRAQEELVKVSYPWGRALLRHMKKLVLLITRRSKRRLLPDFRKKKKNKGAQGIGTSAVPQGNHTLPTYEEIGEYLREMEKNKGGRPSSKTPTTEGGVNSSTYEEIGVTKKEAEWADQI